MRAPATAHELTQISHRRGISLRTVGVLTFVGGLLVFLLPAGWAGFAGRTLLGASVVASLGLLTETLGTSERRWIHVMGAFFAALVIDAALILVLQHVPGDRRQDILLDLLRQIFLFLVAAAMVLHLRTEAARHLFAAGMTLLGLACALIVLYSYLSFAGFTLHASFAEFKYAAHVQHGLEINPLSFVGPVAMLAGWSWWGRHRALRAIAFLTTVAATAVSGSRATQVAVLGMVPLSALLVFYTSRRMLGRVLVVLGCAALVAATIVAGMTASDSFSVLDASAVTKGRLDLWIAAASQIAEHPLLGMGAKSYRALLSHLPDFYQWGPNALAEAAESGGYHQAYLGLLAQRGILGFLPGMAMLLALWRQAFSTRENGYAGMLLVAALSLRGLAEEAGLFGAADGLLDFVVYACAAFIVSTAAASRVHDRKLNGP